MVGPESPNYIDIPRIVQPFFPQKKKVKGVLPVPREIFPSRRPDKATESYIEAATPEPASNEPKVDKDHPLFERLEWKRRMAQVRRQSLREGLTELYERKQESEYNSFRRSRRRQAQRMEVLKQPPREDERLTAVSTMQELLSKKTPVLPDPHAEERLAKARANVAIQERLKTEEKIDAIHTLYMNARNFITTEEQLDREIERAFPEGDNPEWTSDTNEGKNVWNLGPPPTVASMVHRKDDENARWELVQRRTKKIAEVLTGGKI